MTVNEVRNVNRSSERPKENRFPVVTGTSSGITVGEMAGYHLAGASKGQVEPFDPSDANQVFLGFFNGDVFTLQDATDEFVMVDVQGLQMKRANVTGSASSSPTDLVFSDGTGADPLDDLTVTPPTTAGQGAVAVLHEQTGGSTSTEWDIIFLPRGDALQGRTLPGPATTYTADGAITLPTRQKEVAILTGAASAQMTLVVPTAAQIGLELTVLRSAGSGTHDVDYTDEAGNAQTVTLADGEAVTLLAAVVAGWRRIG